MVDVVNFKFSCLTSISFLNSPEEVTTFIIVLPLFFAMINPAFVTDATLVFVLVIVTSSVVFDGVMIILACTSSPTNIAS